ncbi:ras family-domain-containing protein [Pelagophyceae sp. CCMP2097]|nr:ras family-domain-containing protein [Pelagophyceae sp. CCMP2097]
MDAPQSQKQYEFKIVLLGDRGVGKTCLVLRFIEGLYNARQQSTIGAFFLTKKVVTSHGDACKIQIWDTAGQERFRAMAPMYYRNAAAAIVCFDVTDESTFNTMKDWVEELKTNVVDKNLVIAIACNKADLDTRQVSRARAEQFARSIDAIIIDTSAKENFGVAELFASVAEQVIEQRGAELQAAGAPAGGARGAAGGRGLSLAARTAGFREADGPTSACWPC